MWRQTSAIVGAGWPAVSLLMSGLVGGGGGRGLCGHIAWDDQPPWGVWDSRLSALILEELPITGHGLELKRGHSD